LGKAVSPAPLTSLEQLSLVLDSKAKNRPAHKKADTTRRTNVVRIFPHEASCLRLVRALAVEIHEEWAEGPRYLDLSVLPAGAGCTARLAEAA
jgi:hypothetical protein